jgi:two-component system, OmpR family, response regulator RpaA
MALSVSTPECFKSRFERDTVLTTHRRLIMAMRKVFTTGQVARLCSVAPRTVSKWFDSGKLRGYRIPGSQDRRVPRDCLVEFMKATGMPLGILETEGFYKVLTVGLENQLHDQIMEGLAMAMDLEMNKADSVFEAGALLEVHEPDLLIVDLAIGRYEALTASRYVRGDVRRGKVKIFGLLLEDQVDTQMEGFDQLFRKPVNPKEIHQAVIEMKLAENATDLKTVVVPDNHHAGRSYDPNEPVSRRPIVYKKRGPKKAPRKPSLLFLEGTHVAVPAEDIRTDSLPVRIEERAGDIPGVDEERNTGEVQG